MADLTGRKQGGSGKPFIQGQSGNPAGRPKGSRNKLGEAFLEALFEDWRKHGPDALRACREQNPAAYIKVIASLLPKQVEGSGDGLTHLSDDTIDGLIRALSAEDDGDDTGALPH